MVYFVLDTPGARLLRSRGTRSQADGLFQEEPSCRILIRTLLCYDL